MKKYRVRYDAPKHFGLSYETIEARGLVHAFKLAKAHIKEIRKLTNNQKITIGRIDQKEE